MARRLPTRSGQLVPAALGVEGGRAQKLTKSQARRRDRARLAVAVFGGVVGRASAGTVYSAQTIHGEVRWRGPRRVDTSDQEQDGHDRHG
eukprot:scaffold5979_cov69-Phaeocystis_antarctica.AAC.3